MRVITGTARGRKLREPAGNEIRPTTDMVKEALFSIIQFDVEGRRVLDLFAGTGQLGIEALSRGADSCVFVDESRDSINIVKENLKTCGMQGETIQTDSLNYLEHCGKFGLIFVDPPYDAGLYDSVLQKIFKIDILSEGGIIICETRRETELPEAPAPYSMGRSYRYGKIKLTLYRRDAE